jgi:DNA topoisomerase-1
MSLEASPLAAAVPGLVRIDPHGPGITRVRDTGGVRYLDPAGAEITDATTLGRIRALRIPPAWADVWISPDPAGHIQATGTDSKGRLQYLYHRLWREQRDAQKFGHMLRFADALPRLRTATTADLRHHYGATTLQKQHVRVTRDGILFDYTAKWGKQRTIVIRDSLVQPTIRALARVDNDLDPLWCYEQDGRWHILHSRDVGNYIAARAGGHFTAKEFRTWNATVLMALALANAGPSSTLPGRKRTIAASVREVANWLGDTPAVARGSYIDPRLIARYEADGHLPAVPQAPVALPATGEAETAVAALLAAGR